MVSIGGAKVLHYFFFYIYCEQSSGKVYPQEGANSRDIDSMRVTAIKKHEKQ